MKKIILVVGCLVLIAAIIFMACDKKIASKSSTDNNENTLAALKNNSSFPMPAEFKELFEIRDELAYRIIQNKVSKQQLNDAYVSKDIKKLQSLMGITDSEVNYFQMRLKTISDSLMIKYPQLKSEVENFKKCKTCQSINIWSIYNEITAKNFFITSNGKHYSIVTLAQLKLSVNTVNGVTTFEDAPPGDGGDVNPTNCAWAPYIACVAVCTASGPILYWPCCYVCVCSFCTNVPGCNAN
jgi:hypothetical protein